MSYITDFHKAHDKATSQRAKDWLLIKVILRELAVGIWRTIAYIAVSYTHLTLPTICSV